MSSFYDDASLVVIPSGYKTSKVYAEKPTDGSGDLTFTRTGDTATRVNSAGLIEKVRTNLLQQSQNLAAAAWSLGGTATRTANYGIAPDGTQTSTRIQWTAAASFELYQYTGFAVPVYGSVYIKGTNGQTIKYTGNSVTLNGSWQRIEGAIAIDGANTYFTISGTAGTNTAFDFELWGAQAERGDIATQPILTTTAAVSVGPVANVPRLDYLGSTCPRLLLEPQRTNLYTFSEQLNQWTASSATVTANYAVSPDGYTNAERVQFAAGGLLYNGGTGSAGENTLSVYAKATNGVSAKFRFFANGATLFSSDQTATGEWQRFTFTYTYSAVTAGLARPTTNGGVDDVIFYGFQHEIGSYATSLIPTLAASATRGADACSKTGISSLIGQTEGTLFVDYNYQVKPDASGNIPIVIVSGSNEAYIYITNAGALRFELYNAGVLQSLITGTIGAAGGKKIAFAYKANDFVAYMNGVQIGTDTSGTVGAMAALHLGSYYTSDYSTVSGINQALLFKTRLTNADLATLTTL